MSANVESMFYVREKPWHGLDDLVPFHLHPVQTKQGDQLEELVNSIKVSGQTTPITVRSVADGKYEIIYILQIIVI